MTVSGLTVQQIDAAQLIADGVLTDVAIAEQVKCSRASLYNWRKNPEFEARIVEFIGLANEAARRRAVSHMDRRVERLNRDWFRLQRVIDERAADPRMAHVPGGTTGLITHNVKGVGKGEDFQLVDLYEVDTGLLSEIRAIEKQVAQELGQWTEKADVTSGGKSVPISVIEVVKPPNADSPADAA